MMLALDCAATEILQGRQLRLWRPRTRTPLAVGAGRNISPTWCPRLSESSRSRDGMSEDDMDGWKELTGLIGNQVASLSADDLFVTNCDAAWPTASGMAGPIPS